MAAGAIMFGQGVSKAIGECGAKPDCNAWMQKHALAISLGIPGTLLGLMLLAAWLNGEFKPKNKRRRK